jgi:hypothetical protein
MEHIHAFGPGFLAVIVNLIGKQFGSDAFGL